MKTLTELAKRVADEGYAPVLLHPEVWRLCELVAAEEREACAKVYEAEADTWEAWPQAGAAKRKGADAIRARGNT